MTAPRFNCAAQSWNWLKFASRAHPRSAGASVGSSELRRRSGLQHWPAPASRAEEILPPPVFAEWVSTKVCNLKCTHCAATAVTPSSDLTTCEAATMLHQLRAFGVISLSISGGEFLTRSDWMPLLTTALNLFDPVYLVTNGWYANSLLEYLARARNIGKLVLIVSLDGPREVHDGRRGRGSFARALKVLREATPVRRELVTAVARDNLAAIDAVSRICQRIRPSVWNLQLALPIGTLRPADALRPEDARRFVELFARVSIEMASDCPIRTSHFTSHLPGLRDLGPARCPSGREQVVIRSDGGVTGCTLALDSPCGDLKRQSLEEIWSGTEMKRIRHLGGCGRPRARLDGNPPLGARKLVFLSTARAYLHHLQNDP